MPVIEAEGLTKHFATRRGLFGAAPGVVRAVDGISFTVEPGRTLGVVGESGCGKTTTAKLVLGLETPTSGTMRFGSFDPWGTAIDTCNAWRPNLRHRRGSSKRRA